MDKQVYDVLSKHLNENETEIVEDGEKYKIKSYIGNHFCTVSVSVNNKHQIDDKAIVLLNRMEYSQYKYKVENGKRLVVSTSMWIDKKPTKQSLSELIVVLMSTLKSAKILINSMNDWRR